MSWLPGCCETCTMTEQMRPWDEEVGFIAASKILRSGMVEVGPMLGFTAAVMISIRTTTAWEGRRISIMGLFEGQRCIPQGYYLSMFLSIKVHLFVRGLFPDTRFKVYTFILRLPFQSRRRSCLLTFL